MSAPHSSNLPDSRLMATREWVQSRGTNLVTNGTGYIGDNTNFYGAEFDPTDAPDGIRGSFVPPAYGHQMQASELVPVNPANRYSLRYWARQRIEGAMDLGRYYSVLSPYDAYGSVIVPYNYCYQPGTTTVLAADLAPGDTTVHLDSAANWYNGTTFHTRTMTFWNYTDRGGKTWPVETFTRNYYSGIYEPGGVDYTNNTLTLIEPWSGPTYEAGVPLSNGQSGANYIYPDTGYVPEEWTPYSRYVAGRVNTTGYPSSPATGWPPGTGLARLGFLVNYQQSSGVSEHAFAGIEFEALPDLTALDHRAIPGEKIAHEAGTTSGRPTGERRPTGTQYFDTTLGRPIWWDGGKWINASGGAV